MGVRILSKHWVPVREMYVLLCSTTSGTWTFCVEQQTLAELDEDAGHDRAGVFDALQPWIYRVVRNRVAAGEPPGCYVISAREIGEAGRLIPVTRCASPRTRAIH